jgi:sirohydrochlorin cobaltochelatase
LNHTEAVLAVSFGTSYPETCEKTIGAVERDLASAFSEVPVYRAWTSGFIRKKLRERDGIVVPSPADALEKLHAEGVRDVLVQPTFLLQGIEFDELKETLLAFLPRFDRIRLGRPLLSETRDLDRVTDAVGASFPQLGPEDALVLMGHGTKHGANQVYRRLAGLFQEHGYGNVLLGTVEASPGLSDILEQLDKKKPRKVLLAPFLFVAGDHAVNDLAGSGSDSWKSAVVSRGYRAECLTKGLGEYPEIRRMYLEHAEEAMPL